MARCTAEIKEVNRDKDQERREMFQEIERMREIEKKRLRSLRRDIAYEKNLTGKHSKDHAQIVDNLPFKHAESNDFPHKVKYARAHHPVIKDKILSTEISVVESSIT